MLVRPDQRHRPARACLAWADFAVQVMARTYLTGLAALALLATVPLAFGLSAVLITGNSMRPGVHAGDVVLTARPSPTAPVPMGQVVLFTAAPGSATSGHVLHRVVGQNRDGSLVTAGDANAQSDSAPLAQADVEAVAVVLARWIGLPLYWATSHQYGLLVVFVVLTLLALAVEARGATNRPGPHLRAPPLAVAILVGGALVAVGAGTGHHDATARFTAQAATIGNTWSYPAPNPPARLVFSATPSTASGGTDFGVQPTVALLDADAAPTPVVRSVTLSIAGGVGTLTCDQNPVSTSQGNAAFQGCSIDRAGTYTLIATVTGLPSASSPGFAVTSGAPAALAFSANPAGASIGTAFATQPVVSILDAGGNLTASTASVTLALDDANGAALSCTQNPRPAVSGVATFSGCAVNAAGTYTVTARSGTLVAATSSAFAVTRQATTTTLSSVSPTSGTTGTAFSAKATVSGNTGLGTPAGTVVLALYTSPTCGNTANYATSAQTLSGGATTGSLRPSAGTYYWRATYTPSDTNNLASTSSCSAAITVSAALGTYSATGTPVTVTNTTSNVGVSYPSGTAEGDLAILVVVNSAAQNSTMSATGWAPIATTGSSTVQLQAWWHTVGAEISVSIAQLPTGSSGASAWVMVYKNMPNPTLAGVSSGAPATSSLTLAPKTLTTTAPSTTVISLVATNGSRTLSLSTTRGFSRRVGVSATGGSGRSLAAADRFLASSGALTPPNWTASALSNWACITIAFTP